MLTSTNYELSIKKFKKVASIFAIATVSITSAWAQCTAPTVSGTTICAGQIANLTPSPVVANTSYDWYTVATGGTPIQTANSFTPQLSTSTTYYVAARTSTCTSARTMVTVNVNPAPADGFFKVGRTSICTGESVGYSVYTTGVSVSLTTPSTYVQLANMCADYASIEGYSCRGNMSTTGTFTAIATTPAGCTKMINQTVTVNPIPTVTLPSQSEICENTALNITASTVVGATYTWTGPNSYTTSTTNPTVNVSNAATLAIQGAYTVKAMVNGCTSTTVKTNVYVQTKPLVPVIRTSTCFQPGVKKGIDLSTETIGNGAVWSTPTNFTKTFTSPGYAQQIQGTFASAIPSLFSVYTTDPVCGNSQTTTFTMYPNPVPVISANKDRMCKDETMQLIASVQGGTWSISSALPALTGGATTNSTISNTGLFTGNNPGVYTVRYTVTVNGCSGYSEKVMTVGALPFTISGPDKMCQNQSAVFNASQDQSGKNSQYQWDLYLRSNNTDVPIIGDVNSVPSTSNWDFDKITLSTRNQAVGSILKIGAKGDFECIAGANRSLYASKLVTVVANPSNLIIICADGNCNQLTVVDKTTRQLVTGLTYQWTVGNATTQTNTNPKNLSLISCTVKNTNGCGLQLDWWPYSTWSCETGTVYDYNKAWHCNQNFSLTTTPCNGNLRLAQAEAKKYELVVYPNPASANISFLTEGFEGTASIYNLDGLAVKTLPLIKDETMYNVNISSLSAGMYVLRLTYSNGQVYSAPLIKE